MKVPGGYERIEVSRARAFVVPEAAHWVRETLVAGTTLYARASSIEHASSLQGRGPVAIIPAPDRERSRSSWLVRHYFRGGGMRLLGDRYLKTGIIRPFFELEQSAEVRRRGIPSPEVMCAAVYDHGLFYRGDLVTRFVPSSIDLGTLLFEGAVPAEERSEALTQTRELVNQMARAGVHHNDLNAKNILIADRDGERETDTDAGMGRTAYLLDLDRCWVYPNDRKPSAQIATDRSLERLARSLRKMGQSSRRPISKQEWRILMEGRR